MFLGLIDWDLIKLIPQIINSPYVQLDSSILLMYKIILHMGWLLSTDSHHPEDHVSSRIMYVECQSLYHLQKQRHEDHLMTELAGAVFMASPHTTGIDGCAFI